MSIIIYGPAAVGKTRNAEAFKSHFKMRYIRDGVTDPYPKTEGKLLEFKAGFELFLTNTPPPDRYSFRETRRILSYTEACRLAGIDQ